MKRTLAWAARWMLAGWCAVACYGYFALRGERWAVWALIGFAAAMTACWRLAVIAGALERELRRMNEEGREWRQGCEMKVRGSRGT